jgi:hypothetical protein
MTLTLTQLESDLVIFALSALLNAKRCRAGWSKEEYRVLAQVRERMVNGGPSCS